MIKIFKYGLEIVSSQKIEGAGIIPISVGVQHGVPVLWATVDSEVPWSEYEIIINSTGGEWDHNLEDLQFIGTFQLRDSEFVGHVFAVVGG